MPALAPRLALAAAAVLLVAGCAVTPPQGVPTPTAVPTTPDATPASPSPDTSAPTAPASPSASSTPSAEPSGPAVKASGKLTFYSRNLVSDALKGTCQTRGGRPTITLNDPKNDFYETVAMTVVLNGARKKVVSVTGEFGEDTEGIVRRLTVGAAGEGTGTSASLTVNGTGYRVAGRGRVYETGKSAGTLPFTLTTTCVTSRW